MFHWLLYTNRPRLNQQIVHVHTKFFCTQGLKRKLVESVVLFQDMTMPCLIAIIQRLVQVLADSAILWWGVYAIKIPNWTRLDATVYGIPEYQNCSRPTRRSHSEGSSTRARHSLQVEAAAPSELCSKWPFFVQQAYL